MFSFNLLHTSPNFSSIVSLSFHGCWCLCCESVGCSCGQWLPFSLGLCQLFVSPMVSWLLELSSMSSAQIYDVLAFFFLLKLNLALLDLLCFYMNCRFAVSGSMKKVPGILTGLVEA